MEVNVGDYVRSKYGIAKYIGDKATKVTIYKVIDKDIVYDNVEGWENILLDKEIIKSSPNIIDLLEVGDILSFKDNSICRVLEITNNNYYLLKDYGGEQYYENQEFIKDFKSIVTKEQFESMEYEVGKDEN